MPSDLFYNLEAIEVKKYMSDCGKEGMLVS
jgi:hypothetical protein